MPDLHPKSLAKVTEKTVTGDPVTLVKDGKPQFAIVWDKMRELATRGDSRPSATPATQLLAETFEAATGTRPPVIDLARTNEWSAYSTIIWVGNTPATRAAGLVMENLRDQQIAVRTVPGGLVIIGYDTIDIPGWNRGEGHKLDCKGVSYGSLNAAYDFCERILGSRWYFPGAGVVHRKVENLVLRPFHYESEPYYNTRGNPFGVHCSFRRLEKQTEFHGLTGSSPAKWQEFIRAWRLGGTAPLVGKHTPDPQPMAERFPDRMKTIFYTSPDGKFWYSKDNYFANYFNPVDLAFADILIDVWKEVYESDGKRALPGLGGGMINNTYINFGVSDVLLSPADYISDPVIRREGLVTEEDLNRPDTVRSAMSNVYGRFYKYLCERLEKELPGKTLFALLYYNSKWGPTRYKLPKNFDGIVCDGSLLGYIKDAKQMEGSKALFKSWYDAMGGRAPSMAYIYGAGDKFVGATNPSWIGDIPKVLGPYLGRLGLFFDSDMDWRIFHTYYVGAKAQWDPDVDVQAILDEMWERLYGAKAAVHLKAFQRVLYAAVADEFMVARKGISAKTVDELERLLAAAEKEVEKTGGGGERSAEAKRFALFKAWWPEAFAARRKQLAEKKPTGITDIPYRWSEKIDWTKVPAIPNTPNLRMVWDEKGLYGCADDAFDITLYADPKKTKSHRIKYDIRVPGFTVPFSQFGEGVAAKPLTFWETANHGRVRFAPRGDYPAPKGMTDETMGFKSGEIQTMISQEPAKFRTLSLTIANSIRPYTINFGHIYGSDAKQQPWTLGTHLGGPGVHGFGSFSAFYRMKVNGIDHHWLDFSKKICEPWESGDKRGWKMTLNFDGAMVDLVFFMRPGSPLLYGSLVPNPRSLVPITSCTVELSGIPSDIPERMKPPREPHREIQTVTRTIRPPSDAKGIHTAFDVDASDRWFLLRDTGLDGSAADKGIGPCWVSAGFADVAKATASVGRARDIVLKFDLKPDFRRFTFALWEDRTHRHTNDEVLKMAHEGFRK